MSEPALAFEPPSLGELRQLHDGLGLTRACRQTYSQMRMQAKASIA
jgi:hypothetical protein